jgi:Zn-dependent peptidase ImmA (M78 family)
MARDAMPPPIQPAVAGICAEADDARTRDPPHLDCANPVSDPTSIQKFLIISTTSGMSWRVVLPLKSLSGQGVEFRRSEIPPIVSMGEQYPTMVDTEEINPDILTWARETAGLTVAEAAEKLGLKDTAKESAIEKLQALEAGKRGIAQGTLEKAASLYRRPLVAFYMSARPARGERGEDFRAAKSSSTRENATLDALIRDVKARQQLVRDLLEDDEESGSLRFVASMSIKAGPNRVAAAIRSTLDVTMDQQRRCRDNAALFTLLRSAAEKAGVFVLLLGDVGSWHSDIGENVFRGFALADDTAPFIVINDNDAEAARSFTLLHELAHLWIGASGVSGPLRDIPTNAIERFCNDTASEFLLPPAAISDYSSLITAPINDVLAVVRDLAAQWKVSEPAVTYRFAQKGWISGGVASTLFAAYAERWRQQKQRDRENRPPDETGPSFYTVRRHRLGAGLLALVRRRLQDEAITHTRAAKILGVGPASVSPLLNDDRSPAR